ncbi:MAG: trigger factor [Candidatus Dadabacteria bacterium]|nr:trigger factor [Candidatus Dadabacteria bacterium]MYA48602.1 trigger factor [Candidatus Dadabacteria bacterium]MYG82444.1 trigger factor [Candidatus Dadabacteria bacterium]MYK50031.1 trigger factor [Candidatus Dadabacteria bacterium]
MKINIEDIDSTRKKIRVSLSSEQVAEKRNSVFREIMGGVSVKGFRKGKVPRHVVESMYGKEVDQETASNLVSDTLSEALSERSLLPVTRPDITEMDEVKVGEEFTYSAEFEVIPDFELSDYSSISVKKIVRQIAEKDIDAEVQKLRERAAQSRLIEKDRPAKEGDYVFVDYSGTFEDGETIDDLNRQDVKFLLGEEQISPEFEENLLGKKTGEETEFSVSYPEDFLIQEAAGKTVSFTVKVKEIHDRVLPEVNDDFAKDFEVESVSELQDAIKEQLERMHENEQLSSMREQIVDSLLSNNQFDVPPSMLEKEEESLKARFVSDMQRGGVPEPEIGEDVMPKFTEKATESVRTSIILSRIAQKENVKVTRKQINEQIDRLAASYNLPRDQVYKAYEQPGTMEHLESQIKTQGVLDLLLEQAQVEEVEPDSEQIDKE